MKNKIYTISVLLLLLMQLGCKKILDVSPEQAIDANTAIENDQDANALIVGAYSIMGSGALYGTNLFLIPDLLGNDGVCSWKGTFKSYKEIASKSMAVDNADVERTWTSAYSAINNANILLANLDKIKDADTKSTLSGEAYFVRAILHFELVRIYGLQWGAKADNSQPGIVIKTTPTTTETQAFVKAPRNTVNEVYTLVINDLKQAINLLPEDNGTRANKYTAYAFLSRVYMQQSDYVKARDAASTVIGSGKYKMNASVSAVFSNKNTAESIWEIQQNDQNNAGESNDGMATFYASLDGIGRADVRMDLDFVNSYDANDYRKSSWYYIGTGKRSGNTYCSKWISFSQNLPVVRIAEMYLTRAECNLRLGTTVGDTPGNDLAQIRNPVRIGLNIVASPSLPDVLYERFHELAFEGLRIHDLRRMKMSTGSLSWNNDKIVFPIPQRDINASGKIIVQNPGY